jgi:F-type H+-transporting ATPase subunit alpha
VIWAGTNGYLDAMPLKNVKEFETALLTSLRGPNIAILDDIRTTKDLSGATEAKLKEVVVATQKQFV